MSPGARRSRQGIYLHIPFCLMKCNYCSFNSYALPSSRAPAPAIPDQYIAALLIDIETESRGWAGQDGFASIYLGGGTPSLLTADQMKKLVTATRSAFSVEPGAEITVECNPSTASAAKLARYRELGVTRLSIGVQSLCDQELRLLGRIHTPQDALRALDLAREVGFIETSADVMLGIPGQTESSLHATLSGLVDRVTHVSVYILTADPGTPLRAMVDRGLVSLPDDDAVVDLYEAAREALSAAGLARYEISNYCRPGHRCLHNETYWRRGNYAGLGAGAHSHKDGRRYSKTKDPRKYVKSVNTPHEAIEFSEQLSREQMLLEDIMLGLRTDGGIDLAYLAACYGAAAERLNPGLDGLLAERYLVKRGNAISLSPKGILLHDAICVELASAIACNSR